MGLFRVHNIIDADTGKPFTQNDMDGFTTTHAPAHMLSTPQAREWADNLMQTWPALISSIPTAVTDAANEFPNIAIGMYVVFTPENDAPDFYARVEPPLPGNPHMNSYHIQKIDTFGTPHDTGTYASTMTVTL